MQDLGRHGYGAVGVPPAGAADARSLAAANLLAGNPADAAGLELTLGRAELRCAGGCTLAVTGAAVAVFVRAGSGGPAATRQRAGAAFTVPDGGVVSIGPPDAGLRSYVAVGGGISTQPELGSRSADLHSGIGVPLRAGAILPVGEPGAASTARSAEPARVPARGTPTTLRIVPGPRADWFAPDALDVLRDSSYAVGADSNRTGLRLDGPALARSREAELPSEGVVTGSLQVPHDGKPILLLTDHPTVGGYPVIAVLASADVGLAAQLRPGDQITFAITSAADALAISAADPPVGGLEIVG